MRGDSVRDLYAKTLALLGLGVLAGTGALVDYWPASKVDFPVTEPVLVMPEMAWAPLPAAPVLPLLPRVPAPSVQVERVAAALAEFEPEAPVLELRPSASVFQQTVALSAPPADVLTPVVWTASNYTEVPLSQFEEFDPETSVSGPDMRVAMASADDNDWWITTAVKRTGSSIARTGARTGASFVDLVRAVNRAVRRALPN